MTSIHHITLISGQEYRMPVRLVDADGHAVPIADYDIYGAARRGSETTRMSVAVVDGSSCIVIIPPLEQASYTYDIYLRHRTTTAEVQLMAGNIAVRGRVASMPPATGGGEDVVAVVSAEMTDVHVTVTPIAVATPDAWDKLDRAGDLLAEAIETAGALVPDAQRVIRQEVETGQSAITTAAADAVRQAGSDIAAAGDREVASAADRIRAVSGQEAEAIAAAGDAARQAVAAAGSSATSEALTAIDAAADNGERVIASSINSGINTLGQSITNGTAEIQSAVTAGTGTINETVTGGMALLDGYVGTVSDDLARKSTANSWAGVQTINAPLVANGGIVLSGQDIVRTLWTCALDQALSILSASGWADTSKGLQFGSAYNGFFYGSESGVTTNGINTTGTLTRTDMAHYAVQKHIAIGSPGELSGQVTLIVRVDSNTVTSSLSKKTAYIFGQHMKDSGDVPFEQLISADYTPNVGNIPTCILTLTDDDKLRLDVLYRTQRRQLILTPQGNYPLRLYFKYFVFVWTPTSFGLYWNVQYPPGPWECLVRITGRNLGELYRVGIYGYDDKNYWNIGMTRAVTSLNTLQPLGYADWMTPRVTITE